MIARPRDPGPKNKVLNFGLIKIVSFATIRRANPAVDSRFPFPRFVSGGNCDGKAFGKGGKGAERENSLAECTLTLKTRAAFRLANERLGCLLQWRGPMRRRHFSVQWVFSTTPIPPNKHFGVSLPDSTYPDSPPKKRKTPAGIPYYRQTTTDTVIYVRLTVTQLPMSWLYWRRTIMYNPLRHVTAARQFTVNQKYFWTTLRCGMHFNESSQNRVPRTNQILINKLIV